MRRLVTISGLFAVGVLAVTAAGQPPAADKDKDKKPAEKKAADPTDALIAAALAHDPDVRMARAKIQLAEAELVKARQAVTLKVVTLQSTVREAQAAVAAQQDRVAWAQRMFETARIPHTQVLDERTKLEAAQLALTRAETELKLLTGGGPGGAAAQACEPARKAGVFDCTKCHAHPFAADPDFRVPAGDRVRIRVPTLAEAAGQDRAAARSFIEWMQAQPAPVRGPIPDQLRAALDKKVKLAPKGEAVPLDKALEVFKREAGLDVPVRPSGMSPMPAVTSQGEELPVGAWFQLYQDVGATPFTFYVREYGLLAATKQTAPPDATTLTQFWKAKPAAPPPETRLAPVAEGRLNGKPFTLPRDDAETLIMAAVKFRGAFAGSGAPAVLVEREWAAVTKGDHLRLVIPSPVRYGTVSQSLNRPQEVVFDLSKFPGEYPAVYTRFLADRDDPFKYEKPKPDAATEFTAALRQVGVGK